MYGTKVPRYSNFSVYYCSIVVSRDVATPRLLPFRVIPSRPTTIFALVLLYAHITKTALLIINNFAKTVGQFIRVDKRISILKKDGK